MSKYIYLIMVQSNFLNVCTSWMLVLVFSCGCFRAADVAVAQAASHEDASFHDLSGKSRGYPNITLDSMGHELITGIVKDKKSAEIVGEDGIKRTVILVVVLKDSGQEICISDTNASKEEVGLFNSIKIGQRYSFPECLQKVQE